MNAAQKDLKRLAQRLSFAAQLALLMGICTQALALEALSDDDMSQSTAQTLGILPENFGFQLNGADGTPGTGYVRLIPVGPNPYNTVTSPQGQTGQLEGSLGTFYKKADLYLYGLALSQSNKELGEQRDNTSSLLTGGGLAANDLTERYARPIDSLGTRDNPITVGVRTRLVSNFSGGAENGAQLHFDAPEFDPSIYDPTSTASAAEKSAYNLKLGLWADLFSVDESIAENGVDGLVDRMRLNVVWDGLSINGTQLSLFPTTSDSINPEYNNTLGITGLLRLNSGDSQNTRAQVVDNTSPFFTISTYNGTDIDDPDRDEGRYLINTTQEFARLRSGSTSWDPQFSSVLGIGTAELFSADASTISTPALGGAAPNFDPTEGLMLYNVNINIPLAQSYQPLLIGGAADGKNLKIEVARHQDSFIGNHRKYQRYELNPYETMTDLGSANSLGDPSDTLPYFGSTCNFYKCQGQAAFLPPTHGSITIGTTQYDPVTNQLSADSSQEAIGVSFGALQTTNNTYGNTLADAKVDSYVYRRRERSDEVAGSGADGTNPEGDWFYYSNGGLTLAPEADEGNWGVNAGISTQVDFGQGFTTIPVDSYTPRGNRPLYSVPFNSNLAQTSYIGADNNLGSVAIDGINIHHLEFETAGIN